MYKSLKGLKILLKKLFKFRLDNKINQLVPSFILYLRIINDILQKILIIRI